MKYLKAPLFLMFVLVASIATAQSSSSDIVGKWQEEDNGEITKYYFFEHKGALYGMVYYYKGKDGMIEIEKELKQYEVENIEDLSEEDILKHLGDYVPFKQFKQDGQKWKGKFFYTEKGETTTYQSTLQSINKDQLEVGFKYWGTWDSIVWKRVL